MILSGSTLLPFSLLFVTTLTNCEVSHKNDKYKAAVVEYHPFRYPLDTPPETILMNNVKRYSGVLNEVKENLDIIVFPEATLTVDAIVESRLDLLNYSTEVPNPSDAFDVCKSDNKYPQFFTYLACAAKEAKVYVAVNLIERALCSKKSYYGEYRQCSKDDWDFYNTDVVFDRKGQVVARYRKYHLFGESWMNRTVVPDVSVFETDFGVKFGIFTCFDILFKRPSIDLIKKRGIKNIIYPSMWLSELPFLTALQTQMQWAYESEAVLLSAGGNDCKKGSGGTGIFQGRSGPVIIDYPPDGETKAYVATLPKTMPDESNSVSVEDEIDELARKMDSFHLMTENLSDYTMQLLDPNKEITNTMVCSGIINRICCDFHIKIEVAKDIKDKKQHYSYHMVAYNGVRSFKGVANGGLEVCGIIACTDNTSGSCGKRFPSYNDVSWPVTFTKISITANYSLHDNKMQYPNSLLSSIRPLPVDAFEWKHKTYERNTIIERSLNLKKPQNRLLTFAIYGRDFCRDSNMLD